MMYSENNPRPGHQIQINYTLLGAKNIQGAGYSRGTEFRCECGVKWRTNDKPPSRGGVALANMAYRDHLRTVIATEQGLP